MPDSNIFLYITGELAVLLLVISIFLLFHINSLKKLIRKLEEKILNLRQSIGKSRNETKNALKKLAAKQKIKLKKYLNYLDEEITQTRDHHQSLNPDRDIVLDINPDTPIERQVTSLRHAFLIAEKEARYAGGEDESSWDVLQSKLQQIIHFYESAEPTDIVEDEPEPDVDASADNELIANYKKRIENLERFKKLFFDMEGKWEAAKQQADEYYAQLMTMGKDLGAGEDFDVVLERYSKAFDEVGGLLGEASEGEAGEGDAVKEIVRVVEINGRKENSGKIVVANQEEMHRLRDMAVDQHKVITELKKKLYAAASEKEQQEVVEELSTQLDKQQRYLKEAETCTRLIEDELSRSMQENEELRAKLKSEEGGLDTAEVEKLENLVGDLTKESKAMLSTIASLEQDNQALKQQIESSADNDSQEKVNRLTKSLNDMQQELLNLQTQHIELEERYLELKMK
ncbi:MAG: hypothetical protein V3T17_06015 [Pseudomonadales bacterium]